MRINLKRLTDAVPELLELEFIAEDNAILISTTITFEQGNDLHQCLTKALAAARANNFAALVQPDPLKAMADKFGLSVSLYRYTKALIKAGSFINAIKEIRNETNLGLKEAKDIADAIRSEMLDRGEMK